VGWTVPKEDLRAIFAALSGHAEEHVVWEGEPRPFAGEQEGTGRTGLLVLDVISRAPVGWDEEVRDYPDADTTTITLSGHRVLTLQARAEEYDADEGFDVLEEIGLDLSSDDSRALFEAVGVALTGVGEVRPLEARAGNAVVSFATLDFTLNQAVSKVITKSTSSGDTYINEVELTGEDDLSVAGTFTATSVVKAVVQVTLDPFTCTATGVVGP
jgi:hypothetical protein